MKRFEFSLEKMLGYKNQVQSDEKQRLAEFRRKLDQLLDTLTRLREEYIYCNRELNEKVKSGLTPQQMFQRKAYLGSLNDRIKLQAQHVRLAQNRVSEQISVVVKVSQDISTLEKLREHQYEGYRLEESKESQLLIEEFVSNSSFAQ
ncbi:MAG: flagellar export protein FliJ [Acetanaerobacterium sp.]